MINRILVVGGTSTGLLCALGLKTKLPDIEVRLVRHGDAPTFGPGDSSTIPLTRFLHGFLGIDMRHFINQTRSMWKLGTRFNQWGPRDHYFFPLGAQLDRRLPQLPRNVAFYCHDNTDYATPLSALMANDKVFSRTPAGAPAWHWEFAYHLDNQRLEEFLLAMAKSAGVEVNDEAVKEVTQDGSGVSGVVFDSGEIEKADLYIDCAGPQSLLLGQTLKEPFISFKTSLPCDRAIIGEWTRTDEPILPYTTAQTMENGWCWQIELEDRIGRGYVYSSKSASDEAAEEEFRRANPKVGATQLVRFSSGRHQRGWVKNVVAVGDAEGLVEPLHGTASGIVAARSQLLCEILMETGRQIPAAHIKLYNHHHAKIWEGIRRILALHYRLNIQQQQTPFWQSCQHEIDLAGAEGMVEYYRQCGPNSLWGPLLVDPVDPFRATGYLTVMVGQKLATKVNYQPNAMESANWEAEQSRYRAAAMAGLTVREALAALPPYQPAAAIQPAAAS